MSSELILGLPVDHVNYESVMLDVVKCIESDDHQLTITSVNPQIAIGAGSYPEVVDFVKRSSHRIPDGIGMVIVSKLTGGKIKERVTGFDLMIKLLQYADNEHKSAFFYGARPEILEAALENITKQYPNLKIAGGIDGYTNLTDKEIVEKINQKSPDFLFVAMGFPKQEMWLNKNYLQLNVKVFQDVGGSFDVISGTVKRAPAFFINHHLEWLYRSLSNPKRIGRIFQLPIFVVKSLLWKVIVDKMTK